MESCGVPKWYVDSCMKIRYLFPKAHTAAYMSAAVRLGWYKIHYPAEYYAAWFTVHPLKAFKDILPKGKNVLRQTLEEIREEEKASQRKMSLWKQELYNAGQIAYEAMARGIVFLPPDPEKSHVKKCLVEDGKIRLPLNYNYQ